MKSRPRSVQGLARERNAGSHPENPRRHLLNTIIRLYKYNPYIARLVLLSGALKPSGNENVFAFFANEVVHVGPGSNPWKGNLWVFFVEFAWFSTG